MTPDEVDECFSFASEIARKAGKVIRDAFYLEKNVETKACATDLVTQTDQDVEKLLFSAIRSKFPSHSFIGEESVAAGESAQFTDNPTWIIDPVDGTTNFVHRFPYVAVCIGFTYKKITEFGIVYNPILEELFAAKRGSGASLNGKPLHVSQERDLRKSLVLTECGSSRDSKFVEMLFENMKSVLTAPVHTIHSLGSAALNICMVARGGGEVYYEFGCHCWDFCAASVILEEAGGVVMNADGAPFNLMSRQIIAANNSQIGIDLSRRIVHQISLPHDCQ